MEKRKPEPRPTTDLVRRDVGGGIDLWVYRYWNEIPVAYSGFTKGIELGVQLSGEWEQAGEDGTLSPYANGAIFRMHAGKTYASRFSSPGKDSRQVGFIIDLAQTPELADLRGDLRFIGDAGVRDPKFTELAGDLARGAERDSFPSDEEIRRETIAYLKRHAEHLPRDPVLDAKRELEHYFDRELLIEHIAEAASMHPVTFARAFKRRFGLTPATYRLKWRLATAGRLVWARPELSIDEVAVECGFNSISFFHRAFLAHYRATPAQYARRAAITESQSSI